MEFDDIFKSDEEIAETEYGEGVKDSEHTGLDGFLDAIAAGFKSDSYNAGLEDGRSGKVDYSDGDDE
jgi:hypothetical protein